MKTRTPLLILVALIATTLNLRAVTYAELAGVYDCKRTERFSDHTARYNETVVIRPDGFVMNLVEVDGIPTLVSAGYIAIDANGNWLETEAVGQFILKGKDHRLEVTIYWPAGVLTPEPVSITVKGKRTADRWEDWMVWLPE